MTARDVAAVMEVDAARRLTERIRLTAHSARENLARLQTLVQEAQEGQAHIALGYASWTAYLAAVFGEEPLRLPRDQRQELVGYLAGEGMSSRAIAPIVGANHSTIVRDLQSGGADAPPAVEQEIQQYAVSEEAFVEHFGMRPDIADGLISSGLVTTREEFGEIADKIRNDPAPEQRPVTGLDGKRYTRPEPKPKPKRRPLPAAWHDVLYGLQSSADRLARLADDDRFPAHRAELAQWSPELARISETLEGARQALTGETTLHNGRGLR